MQRQGKQRVMRLAWAVEVRLVFMQKYIISFMLPILFIVFNENLLVLGLECVLVENWLWDGGFLGKSLEVEQIVIKFALLLRK